MVASVPLAVALSVLFAVSGGLALRFPPAGPERPMAAAAGPAMSASMLAMTWTRLGALVLSWQAVVFTLAAAGLALDAVRHRSEVDSAARAVLAAGSVGMLVGLPVSAVTTVGLGSALLTASAFWTVRAVRGQQHRPGARAGAGCHALMGLGMTTMLLAMAAGW